MRKSWQTTLQSDNDIKGEVTYWWDGDDVRFVLDQHA
jgi:hypothetical protein